MAYDLGGSCWRRWRVRLGSRVTQGCGTTGEFLPREAVVCVCTVWWVRRRQEAKLWKHARTGRAVALARGEPELLQGFPAALHKLKWLLADFVTSCGENDHIKEIVWTKKEKPLRLLGAQVRHGGELSERSKLRLLWACKLHALLGCAAVGEELGWCSGLQMQSRRVVVGVFLCLFAFKILSVWLFGCWVPVEFFLGYLDTVKFLRSQIRGI